MYMLFAQPREMVFSRSKEGYMELHFVKNDSVSQQEKAKLFWKFLDAQDKLQLQKDVLKHDSPSKTEASSTISSTEETTMEKDIWRKGLKIFRQFGLDKTALAASNKCRLCAADRTIQCDDLADTVTQPYEELDADMKAFEQRQIAARSSSSTGRFMTGRQQIRLI